MRRLAVIGILLSLAAASPAWADVIELQDGRVITGSLLRKGDDVFITSNDGKTIKAKPSDVTRVTLTSSLTPTQAADAEWTRDAAEIKKADNLQTIINLHQQFLDKYPDAAAAPGVRTSLEQYQQLAKQNGVKFRGRWMPEAQVQVQLQDWADRAKPALVKYKAGDLRGALDSAKAILKDDSANPDALALAGLAAYHLNMTGEARDNFAALTLEDPASLLGENNLAVILFSQKRQAESLLHYAKALQVSPDNRFVADNIEEALNAYAASGGNLNAPAFVNLVRQFQQAESRIEAAMARKGLYRFGSTWVPAAIMDRLNANLQQIKNAMTQLDSQYQSARAAAAALDAAIAQANSDYNTTALNISYLDSLLASTAGDVGNILAQRDDLQRNLQAIADKRAKLLADRQNAAATLQAAPAQADKLKAAYAAAAANQFTGIQRILDWGEQDNPPPPTIIQIPSPLPVELPTPVPAPDPNQQSLTDTYQQTTTPFGVVPVIAVPVPVRRGGGDGRGHDRGGHGGGNDRHGRPVPIGPLTPQLPVAPQMNILPPTITGIPGPTAPPPSAPTTRGG
ncbi:MAG: hypothetical protein ACTHN5_06045 [Phycisphaerae bacterium]